jgi:hypothetical protein
MTPWVKKNTLLLSISSSIGITWVAITILFPCGQLQQMNLTSQADGKTRDIGPWIDCGSELVILVPMQLSGLGKRQEIEHTCILG